MREQRVCLKKTTRANFQVSTLFLHAVLWAGVVISLFPFLGRTVSKHTEDDAFAGVLAGSSAGDIDELIAVLDQVLHVVPEKAG
jgi:hypothetical protein